MDKDADPKTEAKGGTRIAALNNFLNKVTCANCGAGVGDGRLKLVSSKVQSGAAKQQGKVVFTYKCFNEIEQKGFMQSKAEFKPCGKTAAIEIPEDWTK